jgi:uncharacterized protein (DUF362 family)
LAWPDTPEEVDADLFQDVVSSCSEVLGSAYPSVAARDLLRHQIEQLLGEVESAGPILIKTSTTGNRGADHEVSTDLLEFVIKTVCGMVPSARVFVGDGPVYATFADESDRLGWTKLFRQFGITVVDLNTGGAERIADRWPVAALFVQAACIFNLCKAKTHRRFGVSLGLKSLLGVLTGHVPGPPKLAGSHRAVPCLLRQLAEIAPPTLTIIDGLEGIEGEGPLEGTPSSSRFLCVGRGFYGPDVRATVEMGFDPALIPYFLRPRSGSSLSEPSVQWQSLRVTNTDFLPPRSCPWLYRSVTRKDSERRVFRLLSDEVRSSWLSPELSP